MKSVFYMFIFLIISINTWGQERLMIGDKVYSSTPITKIGEDSEDRWNSGPSHITFLFAKNGNQVVFIIISYKGEGGGREIKEPYILYFDDDSTIKLGKKDGGDFINNTCYEIFNLTEDDNNKLRTVNISAIRCNWTNSMGQCGATLIENKGREKTTFNSIAGSRMPHSSTVMVGRIDVPLIFRALFK